MRVTVNVFVSCYFCLFTDTFVIIVVVRKPPILLYNAVGINPNVSKLVQNDSSFCHSFGNYHSRGRENHFCIKCAY